MPVSAAAEPFSLDPFLNCLSPFFFQITKILTLLKIVTVLAHQSYIMWFCLTEAWECLSCKAWEWVVKAWPCVQRRGNWEQIVKVWEYVQRHVNALHVRHGNALEVIISNLKCKTEKSEMLLNWS